VAGDGASLVVVDDPTPQQVPDVGGETVDGALLAIKGKGVVLTIPAARSRG
jgi:hypothetical protein